jgi:hypothetical protein
LHLKINELVFPEHTELAGQIKEIEEEIGIKIQWNNFHLFPKFVGIIILFINN